MATASRTATLPVLEDLVCDCGDGGTSEEHTSSSMSGISFHASIIRFIDSRTIFTCIAKKKMLKKISTNKQIHESKNPECHCQDPRFATRIRPYRISWPRRRQCRMASVRRGCLRAPAPTARAPRRRPSSPPSLRR